MHQRATPTALDRFESQLTPDSPLWAWAHDAIAHRAETMLTHLEGVRLGEDIEAVHDMRVGSRRLVAAMKVFAAAFPGREYRRLLREAREVTRRLGAVRDLDVLIDHDERRRDEVDSGERLALEYLLALRRRERDRARRPMLASLDETARTDYPGRLRRYLRGEAEAYLVGMSTTLPAPAAGGIQGQTPFRTAAATLLEESYREFYAFEPWVTHPEAEEQLHAMRIAAKWLRYTMELFAPAYATGLKEPLAAAKRFQELLGDLHDSDVRRYLLRDALAAPLDYRGLEAVARIRPEPVEDGLRRLQSREERVREGLYGAFAKEWKKLARRGFAESCLQEIRSAGA